MDHQAEKLSGIPAEQLALIRQCCFIHKRFEVSSAYQSIEPLGDSGNKIEGLAGTVCDLFQDPQRYVEIERGWDHEHCDVCSIRIEPGDWYWANERPGDVDLCERCYHQAMVLLQAL